MAIMAVREGIAFETMIESDSAALLPLVNRLREGLGPEVHVLRDPTTGWGGQRAERDRGRVGGRHRAG